MKQVIIACVLIITLSCKDNSVYKFAVLNNEGVLHTSPIALDLEKLGNNSLHDPENLILLNEGRIIPFQLDKNRSKLWFVHTAENGEQYTLKQVVDENELDAGVRVIKSKGDLNLTKGTLPLLTYRFGMTYPPEGVDSVFGKSGYIHPLLSPSGDTLSRIQPPDHYHHYGIWGPWTRTRIKGEQVDFWNLGEKQGTVHFKEFNELYQGAIYAGFSAQQQHINLTATEPEKQIALNENLAVRVWDLGRPDHYMVDYTTTFNTPLGSGILFEAYRYGGGLGMRFTERWHKDNVTVLTSEGKDRLTADGTNARWCMVTGASANGKGTNGILFMSYPKNRAHPEPMRVWPIDGNGGRGDMFFEFCPIRHEEWTIEPNKEYTLNYRMLVFEGELTKGEAEAYWQSFANPPQVEEITN
ncbi:DUF6807 domain-containing protein [Arenibacter amylolyticus]|uniref:DUF6807 domain-containing protein n=1 Tax=Arenibacter amylolyticus TaxID=1406873 RepID=UPI000A38B7FF|nr:PmoA family protein [Arenibacter amylolyticus]